MAPTQVSRIVRMLGLAGLCGGPLAAQARAAIGVTATVEPAGTWTARALLFAPLERGRPTTVIATSQSTWVLAAVGEAGAVVSLELSLPAHVSIGEDSLAALWTGGVQAADRATAFLASPAPTPAAFGPDGSLVVLLGVTVKQAPNETSGVYTGVGTVTIAY
jgi:hypothetical protein